MTKFVYRMQNVLDLKLKLEEQAKIAFSLANNKLREEEARLQRIYDGIHIYENKLKRFKSGRLDLLEMKRCSEAIKIKKEQAEAQKKEIKIAERNVEIARKKLNDVMVERKTQEILREKAFDEYKKEFDKEESKVVDELVSYQYNGNGKETDNA